MIKNKQKGFSTLLVVIILGIITTTLILYLSTTSFWSVRGSIDDKKSVQAGQIASACAEVALEAMREDNSFAGSGDETINGNICNYSIINNGGNNRTVNVESTIGGVTRKIQINTSDFNPIVIDSWREVADF